MNRSLLLLAGGLSASGVAYGQAGLRVGGSLAALHTTNGTNLYNTAGSKLGYQVGVLYQVPLTKWLAVVPEVQYSRERLTLKQVSYAVADVGFQGDYLLNLHYLSVPVLARVALGPFYAELGPQASLLLGGRQTGTTTITSWDPGRLSTTSEVDQRISDDYQHFDAGACAGLGVRLPAGLGLSVRAYRSLVTLNHERSLYDGEYRRQTLQASLTYQLPAQQ